MTRHNHLTRDIRKPGLCDACDQYHQRTRQWTITVENIYGQLIPQTVEASNLKDALTMASELPLADWFEPDE